jgi:hypothetical protein
MLVPLRDDDVPADDLHDPEDRPGRRASLI